MRTRWKVLIGFAAIAGLYLYERVGVQIFNIGRPALRKMAAAHDGVWSDDSIPVRQAFLQRFPIGTGKQAITTALAKEGFACQQTEDGVRVVPGDVVREKPKYVDCQLMVPAFMGERRWILDLWFDDADLLLGARAAIWNISL